MKNLSSFIAIVLLVAFAKQTKAQNPFNAPLYWSVYEHHIEREHAGVAENYISEQEFQTQINWVEKHLKPYGYEMICLDGWGDDSKYNEYGYRTTHSKNWEHDYVYWANNLQERGMNLGMYGNPLWVIRSAADAGVKIKGTDIPLKDITNYDENALWFTWVQVDKPGAEEYVKGYVQHFADMGIKYFRVDFLSWFETGTDQNLGTVGPNRPKEHYEIALRWMKEACDANGMFLSLVMPHLNNEAELELKYGHMVRVNDDVGTGGWEMFSDRNRGVRTYNEWSQYDTAFDGYIYWSSISGRNKMILDGDFIRINTMANNEEKKSVISLHILAGGPVSIADQAHSIKNDLWLYQNKKLLALREDGFVAKPLSNDPNNADSQIWKGQLSNGDWVVGFFNREGTPQTRTIDFSSLGIEGNAKVRDLWSHQDLGEKQSHQVEVPAHGVQVIKVVPSDKEMTGINGIRVSGIEVLPFTEAAENAASVKVKITDLNDNPVSNVLVTVKLTGSFNVDLSGNTNDIGEVVLTTSEMLSGALKVDACVKDVSHAAYVYAADQNESTCIGEGMYVGGTFNNWNLSTQLQYKNNMWVVEDVMIKKGEHQLKFANTTNWTGDDWGNATGKTGTAKLTTGGDPNITFILDEFCFCTIKFNPETLVYSISDNKPTQSAMFFAGDFSNWSLSENPMQLNGNVWEGMYSFNTGDYELKFANTSDWTGDDWGNAQGLSGLSKLTTGGDPNLQFSISESREYIVRFNDQTLEYSIEPTLNIGLAESVESIPVVKIAPNPTLSKVLVETTKEVSSILIYNSSGSLVIQTTQKQIDVSEETDGLYYLLIITEDGQKSIHKIVIRH